jgi:hypothetical protein
LKVMTSSGWILLAVVMGGGAEPARSTLEATTPVDRANDRCLDHAVKELGMSARRVENERRWTIGPQFLHPSIVPEGRLWVQMKPTERETLVQVTAQWPGPAKESAVQAELEDRITAIAGKLAQTCGVVKPAVRCTLSDAGAPPGACKGR